MPVARLVIALVLLEVLTKAVAWACSCAGPGSVAGALESGDTVVLATVRSVGAGGLGCGAGNGQRVARIDVTEVFAGDATVGERTVRTNLTEGACGLDLYEGEAWLLQIHDEDQVSLCTLSQAVSGPDDPTVQSVRDATSP